MCKLLPRLPGPLVLAAWLVLQAMTPAAADDTLAVRLPLVLDPVFLEHALTSQVYTEPGRRARVFDDGSGCHYLVLSEPRVTVDGGRLRLVSRAEARVGRAFGERCVLVVDFSGDLATWQQVAADPGGTAIAFEVVDSALADGGTVGDALWNMVKQHVHPRIGAVRIDLAPALTELRAMLPLLLPGPASSAAAILDSVVLQSAGVVEGGVEAVLGFSVPAVDEPGRAPAAPAEEALSEEELARFGEVTRAFDGFVTYVVKSLAARAGPEVRRGLLTVLIEARYDILRILASDVDARGPDPVRTLFLGTWSRLRPLLRELDPSAPGEQGLNLLGFIAAADALAALDAIGPPVALALSTDGLRRMARMLAPAREDDPLQVREGVDEELRGLFDFPPPRPAPQEEQPQGWWPVPSLLPAHAADATLSKRLDGWVPDDDELDEYLPLVHRLLVATVDEVLSGASLDGAYRPMFRAMVLATAWQETCWRQFMRANGRVQPLRSGGGAVGIMQVLPAVWRGFYDEKRLAREMGYNAAAGSEILLHYLVDYAIARGEHEQAGGVDNLPRAAYAAYNGGPSHLSRYRSSKTADSLKRIDALFQEKYLAVAGGNELAVAACFNG